MGHGVNRPIVFELENREMKSKGPKQRVRAQEEYENEENTSLMKLPEALTEVKRHNSMLI